MARKRKEKDSLGVVNVPSEAYYGAFTARALSNFQISGLTIDKDFIFSLAQVKIAAAKANRELGLLDNKRTEAIIKAAEEILKGKFNNAFPLDVFQAGAGTPWNMNMNEAIANRANEILGSKLGRYDRVHPNDHVNMSQSSNDVVPTATRLTVLKLCSSLLKELNRLEKTFKAKAKEFRNVMKAGRTHARDAVPITFGQEFSAYASALETATNRIEVSKENIKRITLGGTAVGTGINTHPRYSRMALKHLREITRLNVVLAEDFVERTQFVSDFLEFMNALAEVSADLIKICNDLMLLSSGPRTGLNELTLPPVEPGSSVMPGKINPSIIECCNMVCFQILGNRTAVEKASTFGNFDLNVYVPLIAFNLFNSIRWLSNAVKMLNEKCVKGLMVNVKVTKYYLEYSSALATIVGPLIGYEKAAELAKEALTKNVPIEPLILERGIVSKEQLDRLLKHSDKPNMELIKKLKLSKH